MIDRTHPLPTTRQSAALGISRSSVYALPAPISQRDQELMKRIDRLHLEMPFAGARMLRDLLALARGFVYLTVVVDWYSRRVLAWRVSITLGVQFCTEAVEEAMALYGPPEIMNTDQGSQFTSPAFTGLLKRQAWNPLIEPGLAVH